MVANTAMYLSPATHRGTADFATLSGLKPL
jgi:hypothetical protein